MIYNVGDEVYFNGNQEGIVDVADPRTGNYVIRFATGAEVMASPAMLRLKKAAAKPEPEKAEPESEVIDTPVGTGGHSPGVASESPAAAPDASRPQHKGWPKGKKRK